MNIEAIPDEIFGLAYADVASYIDDVKLKRSHEEIENRGNKNQNN